MVVRQFFTIIELLIAITITVVCVNLLSSLYVRANMLALTQAETQSLTRRGMATMDVLQQEFRNMIIPMDIGWGGDEGKDSLVSRYPIYIGNISRKGGTESYPGIIFHRQKSIQETGVSSQRFGIEQVAIFLAPPLEGFGNKDFLELCMVISEDGAYKQEDQVFNPSLFDGASPNGIDIEDYDARKVISEDVIGMFIDAEYFTNDDGFTSVDEQDPKQMLTAHSHTISSMSLTLTLSPSSTMIYLGTTVNSDDYDEEGEFANLEAINSSDRFLTDKGFFFQNQGFFANFSTGQVFRYTRSTTSDTGLSIDKVMDKACEEEGKGLATGFSFQRHFKIR